MTTKIDISSLDTETKAKLEDYVKSAKELMKGIPVDITLRLIDKPVFNWHDGRAGFVSPHSSYECYCKYSLDWDDLEKQEKAIEDKYNALIKEIIDFSDGVADSLKVDREKFFEEFFL